MGCDPGLRWSGFAVMDDGLLVLGCLVRNPEQKIRGPVAWTGMANALLDQYPLGADCLVVEVPQFDGRTLVRGVAPDVMEVVGVAAKTLAAFSGRVGSAMAVTPAEWKGTVPKEIAHRRLLAQLSDEEKAAIEDAGPLTHNTLDAVGLVFWAAVQAGERRVKVLTDSEAA